MGKELDDDESLEIIEIANGDYENDDDEIVCDEFSM